MPLMYEIETLNTLKYLTEIINSLNKTLEQLNKRIEELVEELREIRRQGEGKFPSY